MSEEKNPADVALGRLGGKARVPKGFAKFGPEHLAEISRKAIEAKRRKRADTSRGNGESPWQPRQRLRRSCQLTR